MELTIFVYTILCVIVCTTIVSAKSVRSTNYTYIDKPEHVLLCEKFMSVTYATKHCVEDINIPSPSVITVSWLETGIAERCSAMSGIKTCVESTVESCENKEKIMAVFLDGYAMCENGQPLPWITEWIETNKQLQIQPYCSLALGKVMESELTTCTSPNWATQTLVSSFMSVSFDDGAAFIRRFYSDVFKCSVVAVKQYGAIIDKMPQCGDLKWNTLITMVVLKIRVEDEGSFSSYLNAALLKELQELA